MGKTNPTKHLILTFTMVRRDGIVPRDHLPSFPETTQQGELAHDERKQDKRSLPEHGGVEGDQGDNIALPEPRKPVVNRTEFSEKVCLNYGREVCRDGDGFREDRDLDGSSPPPVRLVGESSAAQPVEHVPVVAHEEKPDPDLFETEAKQSEVGLIEALQPEQEMQQVQEEDEATQHVLQPKKEAEADRIDLDAIQELQLADLFDIAPPRPTLQRQHVLDRADVKIKPSRSPSRDSILFNAIPQVSRWAIPSETRVGGVVSHLRYSPQRPTRRGLFSLF